MNPRSSQIQITEYGTHTVVTVNASEKLEFSLTVAPKKFADPEVADLRKVVESQRAEITKGLEDAATLSAANDALASELQAAKRTIRNGSHSKKSANGKGSTTRARRRR